MTDQRRPQRAAHRLTDRARWRHYLSDHPDRSGWIPRRRGRAVKAAVYVPTGSTEHRATWKRAGLNWAASRDYQVTTLVIDDDGTRWLDCVRLLADGLADVIVVALPQHVPMAHGIAIASHCSHVGAGCCAGRRRPVG
jgi:hypothetical protein